MVLSVSASEAVPATATQAHWSVTGQEGQGGYAEPATVTHDKKVALAAEIESYRHLPEEWDGEGSRPPSNVTISDALAFLELLPLRAQMPKASVAGDGEISVFWKTARGYIDVGFYGNGKIYFYARVQGLEPREGVYDFNGRSIPKALAEAIASA